MTTINLFQINSQTLQNLQASIKNVSDNIANAQNPDYNRRDTIYSPNGAGSVLISVKRAVDTDLQNQTLDATSNLGGTDESRRIFQNMAGLVGIDNNNLGFIQDKMAVVQSAWNDFEAAPESAAAEFAVVQASENFAAEIRRQFTQLHNFASQESANVQIEVTDLNAKLVELAKVNLQAQGQNGTPVGVESGTKDKIDQLIKGISKYVGLAVTQRGDGSVSIYTKNGIPLVDKVANQFAWDPTNRNLYISGGTVPASYNGAGSLNAAFATGSIGAKVQALDPTSPPTAGTGPQVGIFQKYTSQLSAFVDLFATNFSTAANTPFDAAFITNPSDRATDIIQTTPAPAAPIAQGTGFFITTHTPGTLDQESFAVNSNLLNGSKTVNRQAAAKIVSYFTAQNSNLGSATTPAGTTTVGGASPVGGLTLVSRTPQGIISGITQFLASSQATVQSLNTAQTSTQQDLTNRLSARVAVNSDDEIARLQVLQNLYAATGRLMSAADSLFQTLLSIGR